MINSTTPSDRTPRADSIQTTRHKVVVRNPDGGDQFTAENSAALRIALSRIPEVRPEMVARGRALAADPNYPSPEILRHVVEAIANSPDISEDQS